MEKKYDKPSFSLKDRFRYWFDNRIAKSSLEFIRILIIFSLILAMLIAGLIILLGFNEEGETASVFWNSAATVLNGWMPYFEDGSPGYLILMAVTAIGGILFTSVLIGIITSAIEEKITQLKRGNSLVLEQGHTVLLGLYPGEYTLLRQLILAAAGKPACIVVAENMEREEMEQLLGENLDPPKNFRIICRTVDITDPASLEKCSLETCRTVIVSPTDDARTIKAVLAASSLLQQKGAEGVCVNAIISKNEHRFPASIAEAHNISTLQTNDILAKMIAHSCTQTGLSETFRELFNFEGSEFYIIDMPGAAGLSFEELSLRVDHAVPAGIFTGTETVLNPPADYVVRERDRILVFSEESDSAILTDASPEENFTRPEYSPAATEEPTDTLVFGYNDSLPVILRELPDNVSRISLVSRGISAEEQEELQEAADENKLQVEYIRKNPRTEKALLELVRTASHIVILNAQDKDDETADMDSIFLLLNLRDIRTKYGLDFNITVEMKKEHNQNLAGQEDHTDFLVTSSMSSLILAQLSENPELLTVFREILSNEGSELYLKNAGKSHLTGTYSVRDLRRILLGQGYIFLGHLTPDKTSHFNLPLDEVLTLGKEDYFIVLGEQ